MGLAGVPATPAEEETHLRPRIAELEDELRALDAEIDAERPPSAGWSRRPARCDAATDTGRCGASGSPRRSAGSGRWRAAARRSALVEERAAHMAYLAGPRDPGPPDAHLRHPHLPYAARRTCAPGSCGCGPR